VLHFADPEAIKEIYSRREDFVRPIKDYKLLEVYGPCLSTAGWHDWSRHRKPLAAPFNESIMQFVWNESLRQTSAMIRSWASKHAQEDGIVSVQRDTRTLSLNVLAAIGFHKSYSFHGSSDGVPIENEADSYRNTLQTVLDGVIILMLIPAGFLGASFMPASWKKIGRASESFKAYMKKMLADEIEVVTRNGTGTGGIMTAFVHALQEYNVHHRQQANPPADAKSGKKGLSEDEIYSNLFIINFAGHDTTANTLAFAMMLLAAHPEVQSWVAEELAFVTKDTPAEQWEYKAIFPRLTRCRAVVLETLRLYPPIMAIPKWTLDKSQILQVGDKTITIPPGVTTTLYLNSIHTHPQYWSEPYDWKPSRWVPASSTPVAADLECVENERLYTPPRGTYFPWSDGPQNCPGKKFSEVEAVAVIAHLFSGHCLMPQKLANESDKEARKRTLDCANDVNMEMLLRMVDADRVRLSCIARL
jgi:cytochrome P450